MVSYKKIIAFLAITACFNSATFAMQIDQKKFDYYVARSGSKVANCKALRKLTKAYNKTKHHFSALVPDLIDVPSKNVKIWLAQQNIDLDAQWNALVEKYYATNDKQLEAIKDGILSKEFLDEAEKLALLILNTFKKLANNTNESLIKTKIKGFITNAGTCKKMLITRSTGKEDTEEVSNAGGNVSTPNIAPHVPDVIIGIGKTVASYLSTRSLQQRIEAHDKTTFDSPFVPVLIQHMIGEPCNGFTEKEHTKIPRCGVLYTTEQLGKTPGVVHIESTYGNNEAVVNPEHQTQVALDSYYIGLSGLIHASIKPKYKRLVPIDGVLDYAKNPQNLITISSLSKTALKELYLLAQTIQTYYGSAQDVEFVLDDAEKIIYIVQSRPHQKKKFDVNPEYLKSITDIPTSSMITGTLNILGDAIVGVITHPAQVIVTSTLANALKEYEKRPKHPQGMFAIIANSAGQLSHEAAICNNQNIKTITTPQINTIQEWLKQENLHLIIDIQRGVIINTKNIDCLIGKTHQQLIDAGIICANWLNHPIGIQPSLLPWNTEQSSGGLLEKIIPQFPADLSGTKVASLSDQEIINLLEILKECPTTDIEQHLVTLLSHVYGLLYQERKTLSKLHFNAHECYNTILPEEHVHNDERHQNQPALKRQKINADKKKEIALSSKRSHEGTITSKQPSKKRRVLDPQEIALQPALHYVHESYTQKLNQLFQLMLASANELLFHVISVDSVTGKRTLNNLDARSMQRLYPLKQLEHLFTQLPDKHCNALGTHSLLAISKKHQDLLHFIDTTIKPMLSNGVNLDHLFDNPSLLTIALEGVQKAQCPVTEHAWVIFVNHICSSKPLLNQFVPLFDLIKKLNVTPWWINLSFASTYKQHAQDLNTCFAKLNAEYLESEALLQHMINLQQICHQQDFAAWQNPEYNIKQWDIFVQTLHNAFISGIFVDKNAFATLSPLAACATVSTMNLYVHTFDALIKSVKGSQLYSIEEGVVADVKKMVFTFFEPIKIWAQLIPDGILPYNESYPLDEWTDYVAKIIDTRPNDKKQLFSSPSFSNFSASLGAATLLCFHLNGKNHLEDCFTLIHQSLLNIIAMLMKSYANNMELPSILADADAQMQKFNTHDATNTLTVSRVGITYHDTGITLDYNLPIRDHSIQLKLCYEKVPNTIIFECRFLGIEAIDRWKNILAHFKTLEIFGHFSIINIDSAEQSLCCRLKLATPCTMLSQILFDAYKLSLFSLGLPKIGNALKQSIDNLLLNTDDEEVQKISTKLSNHFVDTLPRKVLIRLFKKDLICDVNKLYQTATLWFDNKEATVKTTALKLFKALVKKGYLDGAEHAAEIGMHNSEQGVQQAALDVFLALIEKNQEQMFQKAFVYAKNAITNEDLSFKNTAFDKYHKIRSEIKLVEQSNNMSISELLLFNIKVINSGIEAFYEQSIKITVLNILRNLVNKDYKQCFEFAGQIGYFAINNIEPINFPGQGPALRESASSLYKAFLAKQKVNYSNL